MASGSNANFDFAVGSTQRGINRLSCGNLMNLIFLMPGIETEVFLGCTEITWNGVFHEIMNTTSQQCIQTN